MVVRMGLRTDSLSYPVPCNLVPAPHPRRRRGLPTGDRHDEEIGASLMVGRVAGHDGRTAFDGGLIRKREGD